MKAKREIAFALAGTLAFILFGCKTKIPITRQAKAPPHPQVTGPHHNDPLESGVSIAHYAPHNEQIHSGTRSSKVTKQLISRNTLVGLGIVLENYIRNHISENNLDWNAHDDRRLKILWEQEGSHSLRIVAINSRKLILNNNHWEYVHVDIALVPMARTKKESGASVLVKVVTSGDYHVSIAQPKSLASYERSMRSKFPDELNMFTKDVLKKVLDFLQSN